MAEKVSPTSTVWIAIVFGAAFVTALVCALAWHFWHFGKAFSI
jgi:predicted membrane channel-forming protein YqfA (hemolysin III family)